MIVSTAVGVATVTTSAGAAASDKAPVTIAFMSVETGPYATPGRHNDIDLAVQQINAHGGMSGHQVRYVAYDANITPQAAVTATQKALGTKPTAIIGYSVDDQVQATAQLLKQSGIPVIDSAHGPAASSNAVHVPNLFTAVPNLVSAIQGSTTYAIDKYHPKSVGIFHTDGTAANSAAATAQALLKKAGVKNFTVRSASEQATDTTQQALAMKGDDVIFEFGFPLVEAVFNTALSQNGNSSPIIGDTSGATIAAYGFNKPAQLTHYAFNPFCYPAVLPTKQAKAYVAAYSAAYPGQSILTSVPYTYDSVELLGAAIKAAGGSLSPAAITKQLEKISYQGACGTYHSDQNHDLVHQVTVVSLANGINPGTLAASYTEKPVPKSYFAS
jgi:branched-chain amino acid transport system substrate-binding protein